ELERGGVAVRPGEIARAFAGQGLEHIAHAEAEHLGVARQTAAARQAARLRTGPYGEARGVAAGRRLGPRLARGRARPGRETALDFGTERSLAASLPEHHGEHERACRKIARWIQ